MANIDDTSPFLLFGDPAPPVTAAQGLDLILKALNLLFQSPDFIFLIRALRIGTVFLTSLSIARTRSAGCLLT